MEFSFQALPFLFEVAVAVGGLGLEFRVFTIGWSGLLLSLVVVVVVGWLLVYYD